MPDPLSLEDLVDVELQLLRDRDAGRDELRRRDRRIGLAIGAAEKDRPAVLRAWVDAVQKEEGHDSLGKLVLRAYHVLGWALTLLGLASGVGTASAVLAYDGTRPVNLVHFLAVFVGLQLLLLTLLAFSSILWRFRDRLPVATGLYGLLRIAFAFVLRRVERRLSAESRSLLAAARGRLEATQIIYGDVERWLLVSLAQRFGLWFNLGALATCLYLVAFSDLAFAWQTTLTVSAETFHRIVSILAAPWSWLYPDGVPSFDVVAASRYFRLDGTFARPEAPAVLGQWWRFLVLCLIVYGLLPRLVLSLLSRAKLRRALAGLRLDHAEIASLLERLTVPLVSTRAPVPESAPAPGAAAASSDAPIARAASAMVVIWGDVPIDAPDVEELLAGRFGWGVARIETAGVDDTRADAAAIRAAADDGGREPIVVLVESFEAPTREFRSFVERLRWAIGQDRPVVIGLLDADGPGRWSGPSGDDLHIWRKHLAALGDPYLRVEALVEE